MNPILTTITALALTVTACDGEADIAHEIEAEPSAVPSEPEAGAPTIEVAAVDQWHARLDHVSLTEEPSRIVVAGHAVDGNVIGEISIEGGGPNVIKVTHSYPHPCEQSYPVNPEACVDELHVTVHLSEQWADVRANAPASLFSDRATAIVSKLPPETEEGRLFCALTIAAAAASCAAIGISGPIAAPGCALGALASLCKCDTFHKAFPDVDWDELCK